MHATKSDTVSPLVLFITFTLTESMPSNQLKRDQEHTTVAHKENNGAWFVGFKDCQICSAIKGIDYCNPDNVKQGCYVDAYRDCEVICVIEGDIRGIRDPEDFVKKANTQLALPPCSPDEDPNCAKQAAVKETYFLWENGVVYYKFERNHFTYDGKQIIRRAMDEFEEKTCIRFEELTDDDQQKHSFLLIKSLDGCWSYVGRQAPAYQPQQISFANGCVQHGRVLHELMHAIGFFHEQSRADRDNYVKLYLSHIDPNRRYNFKKYSLDVIQHLGTRYDWFSIMHYDEYAFSKDGQETIVPFYKGHRPENVDLGQRRNLSRIDVEDINRLYNCAGQKLGAQKRKEQQQQQQHSKPEPSIESGSNSDFSIWANPTTTTTTQRTTTADPNSCKDNKHWCSWWARKETAETYCKKYSFMKRFCKYSCGLCS